MITSIDRGGLEGPLAAAERERRAAADIAEAKAKVWRSIAALTNLVYVVAVLCAIAFVIVGALELTPWL